MNLLLFSPDNCDSANVISVENYQHQHLLKILKLKAGDRLRVAEENGNLGFAEVEALNRETCKLKLLSLQESPPPQTQLSLIIALPRPQMIKRILQTAACMGINDVYFLQSSRVEKSFWQSPVLEQASVHHQLKLGLEQAMATQFPDIHFCKRFVPFIEDELRGISKSKACYIAEPNGQLPLNALAANTESLIAIGPEGGFIPKEVEAFKSAGFTPVSLGKRILKVETAVTSIAAQFIA